MTSADLRFALMSGRPVICAGGHNDDVVYKRVSAIIYRNIDGKIDISVELEDRNRRSVTIADPAMVSFYDEEDEKKGEYEL